MRGLPVPMLSAVGALLLLPGAGFSIQDQGPCLRPIRPLELESLESPGPGERKENRRYFAAPDGRLCERFSVEGATGADPQSFEDRAPSPGRAFLLSAIIPGAGQWALGQNRWVAYAAGEVWAWVQYFESRREGRRLQDSYRDLAWLVARRVSTGQRVDGSFEYYESMTQFTASGAFDRDPTEIGIQPEEDPETFNGSVWALAGEIFFSDASGLPPEEGSDQYNQALRYYLSRAIPPRLAWNWSDNTLQQAEFAELIRASDENLRRGTTMIGLILANHLLSAVDALVSGRLLQAQAPEPLVELTLLPRPLHRSAIALTFHLPAR